MDSHKIQMNAGCVDKRFFYSNMLFRKKSMFTVNSRADHRCDRIQWLCLKSVPTHYIGRLTFCTVLWMYNVKYWTQYRAQKISHNAPWKVVCIWWSQIQQDRPSCISQKEKAGNARGGRVRQHNLQMSISYQLMRCSNYVKPPGGKWDRRN